MSTLLILGAGGHAKVVAEAALASGQATALAFLADGRTGTELGWPVLGPLHWADHSEIREQWPVAVVAIGLTIARLSWLDRLHQLGYQLPPVLHPSAVISPSASVGAGSVIFSQSVLQAECRIGRGVILNTACSIDHDVRLADGVHIAPGAHLAGNVSVGYRSWIGIGAAVIQKVRIGDDVTVGAGAAVIRDLPDGVTAVGVPARVVGTSG